MAVMPVIERELRAQSRSKFTYLLRVLAAAAVLAVCIHFSILWGLVPAYGRLLFAELHGTVFASIWLLVPLIAADCISSERREGTLGLLFLTPLRSREIVMAKGLVHGLRAVTLWLAVLPVMTISFLVGGISWAQMLVSVLINLAALCLALAAGVIASSFAKRWGHALTLAAGLALIFFGIQAFVTGLVRAVTDGFQFGSRSAPADFSYFSAEWLHYIFDLGFGIITGLQAIFGAMLVITIRKGSNGLLADAEVVVFAIGWLLAIIQIAAWNMRRVWQEEPPSARQVWLEEKLMTPVIGVHFLRAWLKRKLDRNPVGWLEQRSWTGRIVTWGWFSVMISFYSVAFRGDNIRRIVSSIQQLMPVGMLIVMAGVACGSFQRERETRVLELLLISPMKERDVILGRLRGLWGQFLPCLALVVFVQIYFQSIIVEYPGLGFPYYCSSYFALPVIGLYYALKSSNFIAAFLSTLIVGLVFPAGFPSLASGISYLLLKLLAIASGTHPSHFELFLGLLLQKIPLIAKGNFLPVLVQGVITVYLGLKLQRHLVRRNFAFVKAAS